MCRSHSRRLNRPAFRPLCKLPRLCPSDSSICRCRGWRNLAACMSQSRSRRAPPGVCISCVSPGICSQRPRERHREETSSAIRCVVPRREKGREKSKKLVVSLCIAWQHLPLNISSSPSLLGVTHGHRLFSLVFWGRFSVFLRPSMAGVWMSGGWMFCLVRVPGSIPSSSYCSAPRPLHPICRSDGLRLTV